MYYKSVLLSKVDKHAELQKSLIKNFLSFIEILRILDDERVKQPGYGPFPLKIQRLLPMKGILKPLEIGLKDATRREEELEVPVWICLQKVNMQDYMQVLQDLNYSNVTSFGSLSNTSIRSIVEEKMNLDKEKKENLAIAVECLEEYTAEQKRKKKRKKSKRPKKPQ